MTQGLTKQKREKLRALLATTVNAIVAAKDEVTKIESDLIKARSVAQEAIAELEAEYI
jgi:hypothetical protein